MMNNDLYIAKIDKVESHDIRFPTSLSLDGSDAVHKDPDYSAAYAVIYLDRGDLCGHGFTFTCGRGTELGSQHIVGFIFMSHDSCSTYMRLVGYAFSDYSSNQKIVYQALLLGPEKGVVHLATAALINALWDLWAKIEGKTPDELVKLIPFRHITDAVTPEYALDLFKESRSGQQSAEKQLRANGLPAYVTSVGWMGYDDQKITKLLDEALETGWTNFKMKVGVNLADDARRAKLIRDKIGPKCRLMIDANQVWDVEEAITWVKNLRDYQPFFIEEPTSPDDILGHAEIAKALNPIGILVATGEHCQNRIMFKQFLKMKAMQICQIDACRVGGVNEILAILLLAKKFDVPVWPHAGGVGLCEYVVHLQAINCLWFQPPAEKQLVEYSDHLHEHFVEPVKIKNGHYLLPQNPGYTEMKESSIKDYSYPHGRIWQELNSSGKIKFN